jgi:hypothetical protein
VYYSLLGVSSLLGEEWGEKRSSYSFSRSYAAKKTWLFESRLLKEWQ